MRTQWIRRLAGGAGVLAGLWLALSAPPSPAKAPLPPEVTGSMLESDIAFVIKSLDVPGGKGPEKATVPTIKAAAMIIARYAQNNMAGKDADAMAALRAQALKVADAIAKKDFKAALAEANKLKAPPPSADKKPLKLHEMAKFDLAELMSAYRKGPKGLNIETDIRAQAKSVTDVKVAGQLAANTAILGEYTLLMPSEKAAANPANKKKWDGYTNDMIKLANAVADESAKGAKADKAMLKSNISKLDGSCTACHNEFRE